jgi:uncharacterized protein HemX
MSSTTASVAIVAAFTLGPVLLLAFQQQQKRERRRKRGQLQPKRRPTVRYHVLVFRNERNRGA